MYIPKGNRYTITISFSFLKPSVSAGCTQSARGRLDKLHNFDLKYDIAYGGIRCFNSKFMKLKGVPTDKANTIKIEVPFKR